MAPKVALGIVAAVVVAALGLLAFGGSRGSSPKRCSTLTRIADDGSRGPTTTICTRGGVIPGGTLLGGPDPGSQSGAPSDAGITFGRTGTGSVARITDIDTFCEGYRYFHTFRQDFEAQLATAASMAQFGAWYDANDGLGKGGLATMAGAFALGPNTSVEHLHEYLSLADDVARLGSVAGAKVRLMSETSRFTADLAFVDRMAAKHC